MVESWACVMWEGGSGPGAWLVIGWTWGEDESGQSESLHLHDAAYIGWPADRN